MKMKDTRVKLQRCSIDTIAIARAACECARLALPYALTDSRKPKRLIERTEAYCRGEVRMDNLILTIKSLESSAEVSDAAAYAAIYAARTAINSPLYLFQVVREVCLAITNSFGRYSGIEYGNRLMNTKCAAIISKHVQGEANVDIERCLDFAA